MIDKEGYRPNVAIVLVNPRNQVFWGKRVKEHAWQFPAGRHQARRNPVQAMYRELEEEIGLQRSTCGSSAARATGCATTCPSSGCSAPRAAARTGARSRSGSCCAWAGATATSSCARAAIPSSTRGAGTTTGSRSRR